MPQLAQCRDAIDRQLGQLTRLVDDLLDLSRIKAGKVKLDFAIVAVRDVVTRAAESVQAKASARAQHIEVGLPDEPVFVRGDKSRLVQVLHNLLDNASKFSPKGSPIMVSVGMEGARVAIRVTDRGPGIAPAALDTIFDMFEQQGVAGSPQGGLGLGLALCRSFVRLHDGTITAESAGRGHGATFTVRLASVSADADALPLDDQDVELPAAATRVVLVVDDNRDSADTMGACCGPWVMKRSSPTAHTMRWRSRKRTGRNWCSSICQCPRETVSSSCDRCGPLPASRERCAWPCQGMRGRLITSGPNTLGSTRISPSPSKQPHCKRSCSEQAVRSRRRRIECRARAP
jgi:anti-sigma regulatory factor (Ser/Thr protein kinase)